MKATFLFVLFPSLLQAGLADRKGVWDFDSSFAGYFTSYTPINASSLVAGTDYSFGTEGAYTFLQTQPFTTTAKRLTVSNPTGPNGGPGATKTNQWTVVMDVKLDALYQYAGLIQFDPTNATDVSIYTVASNPGDLVATISAGGTLSAIGAFAKNTWYRLAITCGNDGNGGGLTLKCYLNGVVSGSPKSSAFNGTLGMQSTFHLFTDNTVGGSELKPAKLNSFAFWGEELSAADIASLGGPTPGGILPQGLVDAASPPFSDSTISAASPYSYGANIGWIHARPSTDWGIVIGEHTLSGFAHSANCGWITFGDGTPANGIRYANTDGIDSGVNQDGLGNLYGLAWGANIGWINFGTDAIGTQRSTSDVNRPRFNLLTGEFSGYAHGANVGWIDLSTLKAATLATPDSDGDGLADAWELQYFTYLTAKNGTLDSDGDGVTDGKEYLAGTDPTIASSNLRILSQTLGNTLPTAPWNITFTSNQGRVYQIEKSTTLGGWVGSGTPFLGSTGSQTNVLITETLVPKDFLRIKASLPLQP